MAGYHKGAICLGRRVGEPEGNGKEAAFSNRVEDVIAKQELEAKEADQERGAIKSMTDEKEVIFQSHVQPAVFARKVVRGEAAQDEGRMTVLPLALAITPGVLDSRGNG